VRGVVPQVTGMTKPEQRRFVRELVANVRADLVKNVKNVPDNWDGHELRQWIADRFQESSWMIKAPENRGRYRAYKHDVRVMRRD